MNYDIRYDARPRDLGSKRYLFVVCHQRSFSSVLCHILGSHPEIDGYTETHQSYMGRGDLRRLSSLVQEMTGDRLSGRYVLDKILDADQYLSPEVLARPEVSVLFLVRNARDTISSILNMYRTLDQMGRLSDPGRLTDPQGALDYYMFRLQQIESYSAQRRSDTLFIESERLIDDTDSVLERLTRWLGLSEPLGTSYRTFKLTGAQGHCDTSASIRTGSLVRDPEQRRRDYLPMTIPEEIVRRGEAAHARCRDALMRWSLPA